MSPRAQLGSHARSPIAAWAIATLGALCFWGATASASADATVVVYVRRAGSAIDATVTVKDASGTTSTCHTEGGSCQLEGIAAGRSTVVARVEDGASSEPRSVMIPPDGKVSLFVSVPEHGTGAQVEPDPGGAREQSHDEPAERPETDQGATVPRAIEPRAPVEPTEPPQTGH